MYSWQVFDCKRASYIQDDEIVTLSVPDIQNIPLRVKKSMMALLADTPREYHSNLMDIIWTKQYESKELVIKGLAKLDVDSRVFMLNYIRNLNDESAMHAVKLFVLFD